MTNIMAVLNALSDPAFFLKDGIITHCNMACDRYHITNGTEVPSLTELLPDSFDALHTELELEGVLWEATVQKADDAYFVLLKAAQDHSDLDLLLTAARGLQAPLTSVFASGNTLFSALEDMEDEHLQENAGAVARGCFRLLRAVHSMTEYHRLSAEDVQIYPQKTRVKEFFDNLAQRWTDILWDSQIRLEYHGPEKPFNGNLDKLLTEKAVLCLLSNAATYHEPETPIVLQVSYMGNRVKIQVKNQGTVAPDLLSTAFSRFRHPTAVGDSRWGAGFGLPLALTIARLHKGTLLLESSGGATTATLLLNLQLPENPSVQTSHTDLLGGHDPALVELSGILPNTTFDSRNVDL